MKNTRLISTVTILIGVVVTASRAKAASQSYYFSQLAFAGGFQSTLTYVNYSPQAVTCTTNFYSDSGGALGVPFRRRYAFDPTSTYCSRVHLFMTKPSPV